MPEAVAIRQVIPAQGVDNCLVKPDEPTANSRVDCQRVKSFQQHSRIGYQQSANSNSPELPGSPKQN